MHDAAARLYELLPACLRTLPASARGLQLRRWRYGPDTERLVESALEREHWGPKQWEQWQQEQLARMLDHAARSVPYYRELWAERRENGDRASWEALANWPILEKQMVRQNPAAFVSDACSRRELTQLHTSGTTGTPLTIWASRKTLRAWYALFEARWRRWNGVTMHDRWAIIGGQMVAPVRQQKPPFWVWNAAGSQLYMSAFHISPRSIPLYLDALRRYRIRYIWGYPTALDALASEALDAGYSVPALSLAITNGEPAHEQQRRAIGAAFQCPVRETYGMTEMAAAASECEAGRMHSWPEVGITEVLCEGQPAPSGSVGDLVCTGLLNADMPLIRYRLGDRGAMASRASCCSCGRRLPLLGQLDGRSDEMLYAADGRKVAHLDAVFKLGLPIREGQIVQEAPDRIRIRCVPAPGFAAEMTHTMVRRVQERMGPVDVVVEAVSQIPRGPGGKFQSQVCAITPDDKLSLELLRHLPRRAGEGQPACAVPSHEEAAA